MKTYIQFINEAGEKAGKMELLKTPVDKAYDYAKNVFAKNGRNLDKDIPDFKSHYMMAQSGATMGTSKRKDMPVIDEKDIKALQLHLKNGMIDVKKPFSDITNPKDLFPKNIGGRETQQWLSGGVKKRDGKHSDDKIKAVLDREVVGNLKPTQKQIYADKSIDIIASVGVKKTKEFLTKKSTFVISNDSFIVDGHHRYLSGLLVDPKMKVRVLRIDMPIKDLLKLTLTYSDAVGNKRNA